LAETRRRAAMIRIVMSLGFSITRQTTAARRGLGENKGKRRGNQAVVGFNRLRPVGVMQ
jgi:hypothetical protein